MDSAWLKIQSNGARIADKDKKRDLVGATVFKHTEQRYKNRKRENDRTLRISRFSISEANSRHIARFSSPTTRAGPLTTQSDRTTSTRHGSKYKTTVQESLTKTSNRPDGHLMDSMARITNIELPERKPGRQTDTDTPTQ